MDTRNIKRSKIELQSSGNDNPGSRWKGSLPTEDLSNFGEEIWEGIVPRETQKPEKTTPKFEKKDDYPFGTTRSEVKINHTSTRVTYTFGPTFFKPASLRQDTLHLKDKNSPVNGEFQWGRSQKPSSDIIEQVKNIKPFQQKRFLRVGS
jgi:hypothetical protein